MFPSMHAQSSIGFLDFEGDWTCLHKVEDKYEDIFNYFLQCFPPAVKEARLKEIKSEILNSEKPKVN